MLQPGSVLCHLCLQLLAFGYLISQGDGRSVRDRSEGTGKEKRSSGAEGAGGGSAADNVATEQRFFPSFSPIFSSPPLGHSRPQAFHQETTFRQPEYSLRDLPFAYSGAVADTDNNVLGSGNFGVIRGGTYYTEDRDEEYSLDQDLFPFYSGNNGHGRPSLYNANPPANFRQGTGGDFFANFRDFADITAPTKSSYSEYYVVYVNQNSTKAESDRGHVLQPGATIPKNIIERLNTIDESEESPSKVSKVKQKLFNYHRHTAQKDQANKSKVHKSPKETNEPLLALS